MSSLKDRLMIRVANFRDFLAHVDRADRVYYMQRGSQLIVLASNFIWTGNIDKEPEDLRKKWDEIKKYKGVEVAEFMDIYEVTDFLKSLSSA
ncbi:MAG: hypothetical protein JHC26_05645 [Thermofilum sp.]|jgi:hypothetical protein|uniref:hypothetical protein n=1 Tax=Thermofilum sp. TaxID=1961369 RepID=UPI00258E629F|nr:hypothetical protein [Thermofilum sp.]MCI4408555.1 hypothetical protein [Thermofilum sp.]